LENRGVNVRILLKCISRLQIGFNRLIIILNAGSGVKINDLIDPQVI
jgi:hypothetical protein